MSVRGFLLRKENTIAQAMLQSTDATDKFAVHICVCAACCGLSPVQSVFVHLKTKASWLLASAT